MRGSLTLLGTQHAQIGYGRAALEITAALRAQGYEVFDAFPVDQEDPTHPWSGSHPGLSNVVVWLTFPAHARGWYDGQHAVLYTMFETNHLPEAFRENLSQFDQIVVPSLQNVEMFSAWHDNVTFVPLGVDPQAWHYLPRVQDRYFWFMVAGSGERKGADLAVRAFRKVFPDPEQLDPIPRLIVKSPRPDDVVRGTYVTGPHIEFLGGRCSAEEEIDLYASIHCYLGPSRGEGFGLQPLQALAQGIPTILTNAHGHESFAHLGIPISAHLDEAGYFSLAGKGRAGQWWEPSLPELCDAMDWVYRNYDQACEDAQVAAKEIAAHWTWDCTATRLRATIGEERFGPYAGSGAWHKPQAKRYRVTVQRAYSGFAAGIYMQLLPGHEYWEPADVKRQLFENGVLAPDCLEQTSAEPGVWTDVGLTEDQVDRIGGYRAEHGYCATCGVKFGSGVTKGDEIYAALEEESWQPQPATS